MYVLVFLKHNCRNILPCMSKSTRKQIKIRVANKQTWVEYGAVSFQYFTVDSVSNPCHLLKQKASNTAVLCPTSIMSQRPHETLAALLPPVITPLPAHSLMPSANRHGKQIASSQMFGKGFSVCIRA